VKDPRPVARAVEELELSSGRAVTYEDPPYIFPGATVDVSSQVSRGVSDANSSVLVPKTGTLTFNLPADSSAEAQSAALEKMIDAYNSGENAAIFSVQKGDRLVHVVPREALDASGQLEPVAPALDSRITLEAKPRTGLSLLREICQAASAESGQHVEIATVPANALSNQQIAIGANYEPARAVLEKLIVANPTPLSWQLLYDPGLKTYYLNLHILKRPPAKS
jgi:hypothetical protein